MQLTLMRSLRFLTILSFFFPFFSKAQEKTDTLHNASWNVQVSKQTGAIVSIHHMGDAIPMNWVHEKYQWGKFILNKQKDTVAVDKPSEVRQVSPTQLFVLYQLDKFELQVERTITSQNLLSERYTITNTTNKPLNFPAGALDITVPFHDSYEGGASIALNQNCNAHIWANGSSTYINAIRMSGKGPHLGLILTQGTIAGYSLFGASFSNDRGRISLNPEKITIPPGKSYSMSWKLFWHDGWDDFWKRSLDEPHFVRLKASKYTYVPGEKIEILAESGSNLVAPKLFLNGKPVSLQVNGKHGSASIVASQLGEQVFELHHANKIERLIANVIDDPMSLIKARVNFILTRQQRIDPGSNLDGSFLIYDNETEKQFWGTRNDWNEARERVGMGVLLALYLPHCKDPEFKEKLITSLKRFETFIAREIQDTAGVVYNSSGYKDNRRIYNSPWVGHFHLAMYKATNDSKYLRLLAKTIKAYYEINQGRNYKGYPIGMQILDALNAFKAARMIEEYEQSYHYFSKHASVIAEVGGNYPTSEVAYEQSIVGPGVQIGLEMYLASKDPKFLKSAKEQMVYLEAFNGQQPDYRLNDMAIRHWDGFWFGKYRAYGDTFPHYWQTITAIAFDEFSDAGGDAIYRDRAKNILMNNLSVFTSEGRASCAYLYPLMSMGTPGQRFDPWANDQDWAMVNYITVMDRKTKNPIK